MKINNINNKQIYIFLLIIISTILIINYKTIINIIFFIHLFLNKYLKYFYTDKKYSSTGFWNNDQRKKYTTSNSLKINLANYYNKYNINSVMDLGCGNGDYIKYLKKQNINTTGVDNCDICTDIEKYDLTKPYYNKHEYVQSFEVGEHIPKKYESIFIQNICNNATKGIILSWALVGQGGDGHVNEKPSEEIIKLIEKHGFKLNKYKTNEIRNALNYSIKFIYFKHNILIFDKLNF